MIEQKYLDEFFSLLRFPSISADEQYTEQLNRCAEWLARKLTNIGLEAELVRTKKYPIVWGRAPFDPKKRTVMIYGHCDVQSPDPLELWDSPPFEPVLKNGYVFVRGATDNKGQILAHILGVEETMRSKRDLPVNLHFIIEGEEEIGSPNLGRFLEHNRERIRTGLVIVSDSEMLARGVPTLAYGLRGLAALELKVTGPKVDLHSGLYGGAVANPITALAQLLGTLHDREGRITVSGFHDQIVMVQDWERDAWKKLPIDADREILHESGAATLFGEKGFTTIERLWTRPTAEVNGIGGGYQGKGIKTVIPSHAMAKLTFRLVPNQDPDRILALVREHLRKNIPPGVELEMEDGHTGPCYLTDPHSLDGNATQRSLREVFGGDVALIRGGGSIPILSAFRDVLGAESLLLGLGLPDCRIHSPNENFPVDNLEAGIRLNRTLLKELA
jgi:acetylornithine deacetylase/succinyl-diaminopimelate desuccinylase-like protein